MSGWKRTAVTTRTSGSGVAWLTYLDGTVKAWLDAVASTDGVKAAGRRLAEASVRVAWVGTSGDEYAVVSLPCAQSLIRITGLSGGDVRRGFDQLVEVGLLEARIDRAGYVLKVVSS